MLSPSRSHPQEAKKKAREDRFGKVAAPGSEAAAVASADSEK